MSTWIVPLLGTDFTNDFDKMIIDYIQINYDIPDPDKTTADYFRFATGFYDYNQPYEITAIEQDTRPEIPLDTRGFYMSTAVDINIRMQRLTPNGADPQLGYMEREVIRIIGQYRPHNIVGISDIKWDGGNRVYGHIVGDDYAETDWRTLVRCRLFYEKRDIST